MINKQEALFVLGNRNFHRGLEGHRASVASLKVENAPDPTIAFIRAPSVAD